MAGILVEAQQRLHLDDDRFQLKLGIDQISILRLALCHRPRPNHEEADGEIIAAISGCSQERLQHVLSETPQENVATDEIPVPF